MKHFLLAVGIVFIVGAIAIVIETQLHPLGRMYNNYVLDGSDPYKKCSQLPIFSDAERIVKANEQELLALKKFDNGIIWDVWPMCDGQKGELRIIYGSHNTRLEVEKVIKNNDFHGVPTALINT